MKLWKFMALVIVIVLLFTVPFSVAAEESNVAENNSASTEGEEINGESADGESEEGESSGESADGELGTFLTEDTFASDDIPEDYLKPVEHGGTVERVRIIAIDNEDEKIVKSALVYLPYGYDDNEDPYNIIYLLSFYWIDALIVLFQMVA